MPWCRELWVSSAVQPPLQPGPRWPGTLPNCHRAVPAPAPHPLPAAAYYRGAQGVVLVYDVTRAETFDSLAGARAGLDDAPGLWHGPTRAHRPLPPWTALLDPCSHTVSEPACLQTSGCVKWTCMVRACLGGSPAGRLSVHARRVAAGPAPSPCAASTQAAPTRCAPTPVSHFTSAVCRYCGRLH